MNITKNWSREKKIELFLDLAAELDTEEKQSKQIKELEIITYDEVLKDFLLEEKEGIKMGILTHFPTLDNAFEGLNKGELYIVGAATGIGKSLFVQNIAFRAAYDNKKVLFVTTEMTPKENLKRLNLMRKTVEIEGTVEGLPIFFNSPKISVSMSAIINTLEYQQKIAEMDRQFDLVIIDNLQYFVRSSNHESEEIGMATRECKEMSRKFDLPVILVSHVRKLYNEDKIPELDDLRGSSFISQDADGVISLWRKDNSNEIMVTIKKNRRTGKIVSFPIISNENLVLMEKASGY